MFSTSSTVKNGNYLYIYDILRIKQKCMVHIVYVFFPFQLQLCVRTGYFMYFQAQQ